MRPKIRVYDPSDVYKYAHLKRDGIWLTLRREYVIAYEREYYVVEATTRHPTNITHQLAEHPAVVALRDCGVEHAPHDREFYCELYAPGRPASYVKHALAAGKLDELRIEAFATPCLPHDADLIDVELFARSHGLSFASWTLGDWPDWRDYPDAEGLVYKNGNLLDWAKHKETMTADVICDGFTDGNGKYLGLIGAVKLRLYDGTDVGRCSGMTDAERVDMTLHEEQYAGRVLEVEYQYVGSRGKMRHPRFVRWRDDKRPEECTEL